MVLTKKAQIFTVISIIFISVVVAWFLISHYDYPHSQKGEIVTTRVLAMNSFLEDVESDLTRAIYIAAYRTILSMQNIIIQNGTFIENFSSSFAEIMTNGTYKGEPQSLIENSTLGVWLRKVQELGKETGFILNIETNDIEVHHIDPWTLEISYDYNLELKDVSDTASWQFQSQKKVNLSILGFEDPLYAVYTYGRVANVIQKTLYDGDYVTGNDTSHLRTHLINSWYTESASAPDFIMRLQGNLSASKFGIESLVNLEKLSAEKIPIKTKSVVDYIYFSENTPQSWSIKNMPLWFRLDNLTTGDKSHLEKYEVENLINP